MTVAGDDLVVGTLGRSAWIFDDLTPVRDMSPEIAGAPAYLYQPLPAIEWRYASASYGSRDGAADNPPRGAIITYSLAAKPESEVTLDILEAGGALVRRLSSVLRPVHTPPDHPDWNPNSMPKPELEIEPGTHRAAWDLRYEPAKWVPGASLDNGEPEPGPLVVPGDYTLQLKVGDTTSTRILRVEPDPRSMASAADREAQLAFELEIRNELTRITDMVATIRGLRTQIEDRNTVLAADSQATPLIELGEQIISGLDAVEEIIHNPYAEVAYDILAGRHGGTKLYSRLSWLLSGADDHDGPPTQGMLEVGAELAGELSAQERALDELLSGKLAELNAMATVRGVPYVVIPATDGP
jgi:hypothetical protein